MTSKKIMIGRFGAPFGVRGWIKVQSFTDPLSNILKYQPWLMKQGDHWQPIAISASKVRAQDIIVKLQACDNPETARYYTNINIATERDQLPVAMPGTFYWADLIGLWVITQTGHKLGKVVELQETGANQILIVQDQQKKEHWLPFVSQVILQVDLVTQKIIVDWEKE